MDQRKISFKEAALSGFKTQVQLRKTILANIGMPQNGPSNELAPNELAPNELAPNELAPNELAPNELAPNELAPNELAPNELAPNELAPNEPANAVKVLKKFQ